VHLLPQIAGAADLVLPSKLTNMLASGRPVLTTAEPGTGLACEVIDCGLSVTPGLVNEFCHVLTELLDDEKRRADYGIEARARAEKRWSYNAILGDFESQLVELVRD